MSDSDEEQKCSACMETPVSLVGQICETCAEKREEYLEEERRRVKKAKRKKNTKYFTVEYVDNSTFYTYCLPCLQQKLEDDTKAVLLNLVRITTETVTDVCDFCNKSNYDYILLYVSSCPSYYLRLLSVQHNHSINIISGSLKTSRNLSISLSILLQNSTLVMY